MLLAWRRKQSRLPKRGVLVFRCVTRWKRPREEECICKKLLVIYGKRKFITSFTRACHLFPSWAGLIQSTPHLTSWMFIFILSSHLRGSEAHPASYTMGTGSFLRVKRPGRGLDHSPHLAPTLKSIAIPLLHLWPFVACSRVNFTFSFTPMSSKWLSPSGFPTKALYVSLSSFPYVPRGCFRKIC